MKTVKFHPDAEDEMIQAAAYYETQQSQLGRRFLVSVQDSINRIVSNPRLYPVVDLARKGEDRVFVRLDGHETVERRIDRTISA